MDGENRDFGGLTNAVLDIEMRDSERASLLRQSARPAMKRALAIAGRDEGDDVLRELQTVARAFARGGLGKDQKMKKREVKERGKESQGVLARRNPMLLFTRLGVLALRLEERKLSLKLDREPPRFTRLEPLSGPGGFVDGLDA